MHGYFDAQDGNPKVLLKISGTKKRKGKEIVALFDTGHTGSLSLPVIYLIEIGAKLTAVGQVQYADGNTGTAYYFSVKVEIDNVKKEVEAAMISNPKVTEAIAGLQLFSPYVAFIDFKNQRLRFIKEEDLKKSLGKV